MEEERNQKELFEFEEPKKPFSKLTKMLPKPDFEGRVAITLTLEKMVFISIGIVMLMVIVFALGVENGKSRKLPARREPVQQKAAAQAQKISQPRRPVAPIAAMQPSAVTQKGFLNTAPVVPGAKTAAQKAPEAPKPYTIVAATFSKKETAQATAAFLNKEGFSAFITYSDPYYRVCVGAYADMYGTQVQRDLVKVKRIYKDAFVRLR
jgi:hypothetical protein